MDGRMIGEVGVLLVLAGIAVLGVYALWFGLGVLVGVWLGRKLGGPSLLDVAGDGAVRAGLQLGRAVASEPPVVHPGEVDRSVYRVAAVVAPAHVGHLPKLVTDIATARIDRRPAHQRAGR